MKHLKLGHSDQTISRIGLGCMNFVGGYGPSDQATSFKCLDAAFERGLNFLDTAEVYGMGKSETLLGTYLSQSPRDVVIASKAGIRPGHNPAFDNSAPYLRAALEGSLKRLGRDHIDLYYLHRREHARPVEEVAETMAQFVKEGKIGGYGLSEVAPSTLRRAHAVHPVSAVQNEYSLWTRLPQMGMLQTCAELGTTFVAFSPLARGMMGAGYPDPSSFAPESFTYTMPRFKSPNFEANCAAITPFKDWAQAKGWTVPATALAWILDQGDHIVPIPGTRTAEHLADWIDACDITFTQADRTAIQHLLPVGFAHGDRYSDAQNVAPERYC